MEGENQVTLAEIRTAIRNLINEQSTDTGALLDSGNAILDEFINAAAEDVVLDLLPFMMEQFMTTETVTLVADQANYTLTASFWMIYTVQRNVSGERPINLEYIDPMDRSVVDESGATEEYPQGYYFLGDTIYFVRTPSTAVTDFAKVWLIRPEAAAVPVAGPSYIPRPAHRLIVYKACSSIATMIESVSASVPIFEALYADRLTKVRGIWIRRFQSKPRHVRESIAKRTRASFYDPDKDNFWP